MTPAARVQTAIDILDLIIASVRDNGAAADVIIANWFKTRRYAGSGDRRAVRERVYQAIRTFGDVPRSGRAAMIGLAADDAGLAALFDGSAHAPPAIGASERGAVPSLMPGWLARIIPADEHAALLTRAPFDLRANALKITRDAALLMLDGAVPIAHTAHGIRLPDKIPLANRPELDGLIEIQDAGSQRVAEACRAQPGQTIIDLCAGAGGKTLALAAMMTGQGHGEGHGQLHGRLYACDTDRGRLSRLAPRAQLAGAGAIETRLLNPKREGEALDDLRDAADCVLVDAPCSGSGTWRRNPELRWRLTHARLDAVIALQASLIDLAATLVKPGGAIVYAVCSLIDEEGQAQIDGFLRHRTGWALEAAQTLTPSCDDTDGFFVARLIRAC
jgi:16S rRNA (cytosine967-C5)-methyltransferase